jgi:hypothetical protein
LADARQNNFGYLSLRLRIPESRLKPSRWEFTDSFILGPEWAIKADAKHFGKAVKVYKVLVTLSRALRRV